MMLAMASQDAQNFFQPLSSWMSRVYEALQQAGEMLSASLVNLRKQDSKLDDKLGQDSDDAQIQETYFEDKEQDNDWSQEDTHSLFVEGDHFSCCNSDFQNSTQSSSPSISQHAKDSCSIVSQWPHQTLDGQQPPRVLSSIAEEGHHLEKQRNGRHHCFDSELPGHLENLTGKKQVDSFEDDEELSTSSDNDEEVTKQFEISMSCSQSFLPGKEKQTGLEKKPKFTCWLSNHEKDSTKGSACEDLDGTSQLSYTETLSHGEDDPISAHAPSPCERGDSRPPGRSRQDTGTVRSLSRRSTEGSADMEAAFSNRGFEDSCATDSSSTWSPEQEQDTTHFQVPPGAPEPISRCGGLDVIFEYRAACQKLTVTIVRAQDLPDKDRSGVNAWQVHTVLLPGKKQRGRTSIQRGPNPIFKEKVIFTKLESRNVAACAVRFRLYTARKVTRERMMAEKLFYLSHLCPEGEMKVTLVLEPRSNISSGASQLSPSAVSRSDSASPAQLLCHGGAPELLVGLLYNATTGQLAVEMIKGSHFRNLAVNRAPDTYGKLFLLNSVGQEISSCKTSIRRGQPNPVYKETFVFQVALFQLSDVTLMISVYNRRAMKRKEMIGWIALGLNSSGEDAQDHWVEMKETAGQQVCRWHALLES